MKTLEKKNYTGRAAALRVELFGADSIRKTLAYRNANDMKNLLKIVMSCKGDSVTISTENNSKMGDIACVNVPSGYTCPVNAPCAKAGKCYALNGSGTYSTVVMSHFENLAYYRNNPAKYFTEIRDYCISHNTPYFRWHASGDIVDYGYIVGVILVAQFVPNTKFLCYTKKFELVNRAIDALTENGVKIPDNLTLVFSAFGEEWRKPFELNKHNLPMTNVIDKGAAVPTGCKACHGDCKDGCRKCWNLKKGEMLYFYKH